ncbi:MAG: hypothetical protein AB8B53_06310 [Flavobacteriales bacterium]
MKYILISVLVIGMSLRCNANMTPELLEDSIVTLLNGIGQSESDADKLKFSEDLNTLLRSELIHSHVYDYPFSKVKKMAILRPEDNAFVLFNWNVPLSNGVNKFYCYVLQSDKNSDSNKLTEFKKASREERKMDNRYLDVDQWYGCLYYDIITVKKNKTPHYTLLGYSPFSKASTKKYMDVVTFTNDEVRLGAPIFKTEKGVKKRVIFEFSAEVSMTVRWQEKSNRVILDHLTPRSPEMEGNYMFYGPDGTFDAYLLKKGTWEFQGGVDFQSTKDSNKPYKDPRKSKGKRK